MTLAAKVAHAGTADKIEFEVCDDGPGIPASLRESLGAMPVDSTQGGHGVGLYLAFSAAARLGGEIELSDVVRAAGGNGRAGSAANGHAAAGSAQRAGQRGAERTTGTPDSRPVRPPRAARGPCCGCRSCASRHRPPQPTRRRRNHMSENNFLVIDDNEVFAGTLARGLERRGYAVQQAHDKEAALRLAAGGKFQFITVDLHLGEDSGLSLIAPLCDLQPDARILC